MQKDVDHAQTLDLLSTCRHAMSVERASSAAKFEGCAAAAQPINVTPLPAAQATAQAARATS
jgi:hypothetical protein